MLWVFRIVGSIRLGYPLFLKKKRLSLSLLCLSKSSPKFENLCLWFIFTVSRSFMLFVFWKVVSVRKRRPLFLKKKAFVAITSVSLKIHVESRKWPPCPAPGAPGLREKWRQKVIVNLSGAQNFYGFGLTTITEWKKEMLTKSWICGLQFIPEWTNRPKIILGKKKEGSFSRDLCKYAIIYKLYGEFHKFQTH